MKPVITIGIIVAVVALVHLYYELKVRWLKRRARNLEEEVRIKRALIIMDSIEVLRQEEGDSITILCDNPEFGGPPARCIECCGDWTNWKVLRFGGDTLVEAFGAAVKARCVVKIKRLS